MPGRFRKAIQASGLSIYDPVEVGHPDLWIPAEAIEALLNQELVGRSLTGLPLRTRSKVVKAMVCGALGYAAPDKFRKTHPRFPGQQLDVYTQKRRNLQVWNQKIVGTWRYAIICISADDVIQRVHVIHGERLAELDETGTLTQKYQARIDPGSPRCVLLSDRDTEPLRQAMRVRERADHFGVSPDSFPEMSSILPIDQLFERLCRLQGTRLKHLGMTQERNRGSGLHRAACGALGYDRYHDHGQFPDIRHQLLEIKLQTSPTIDLGLVTPADTNPLDLPELGGQILRHCDVRYAVFYGSVDGDEVELTHVFVTTGEDFFKSFRPFGGKVVNKKLQIPLPPDFFNV
jgi:hypothetical protein